MGSWQSGLSPRAHQVGDVSCLRLHTVGLPVTRPRILLQRFAALSAWA